VFLDACFYFRSHVAPPAPVVAVMMLDVMAVAHEFSQPTCTESRLSIGSEAPRRQKRGRARRSMSPSSAETWTPLICT